jgi:hypothetical protein
MLRPRAAHRPVWTLAEDDMGWGAHVQDEPDIHDVTPVAGPAGPVRTLARRFEEEFQRRPGGVRIDAGGREIVR